MRTLAINTFDNGMTSDPRNPGQGFSQLSKSFDLLTYPHKMVPYRDSEAGASAPDTSRYANFLYANSTLYGLGVVSGSAKAQIDTKTDFTSNAWSTPSNNQSGAGARDTNVFVYYKTTGKIYGLRGGTACWSFLVNGSGWNDTAQAIAYTNTAPAIVHSKDDILYLPYDNKIATNNNDTWNATALTLPTSLIIASICEYGNYLAIGCKPVDVGGRSKVFLWDRDATLATVSESIDWGEGSLYLLEELEGSLVGASQLGEGLSFNTRYVFKYYSTSNGAVQFNQIVSSTAESAASLRQNKQKKNNRVYFLMSCTIQGTLHQGVWSIGRSADTGTFGVMFEYLPNNDTALTSGILNGFLLVGDYMFISYVSNSVWGLSKTNDMASYTSTSIYETTVNPSMPEHIKGSAGDRSSSKQLVAVALSYQPLTSGQQAVLKYRADGGNWTTILTEATVGMVTTERNKDATNTSFTNGREYEFHIESTGGAVITELKYKYEVLETLL